MRIPAPPGTLRVDEAENSVHGAPMMFDLLRANLLTLVKVYTAATGTNAPAVAKSAVNDHNFFRRISEGSGFTVKSYDRLHYWFDLNWPPTAEWPHNVPRHEADFQYLARSPRTF